MNITDKLNSIVNYLASIRIYRDPQRVKNDTTEIFRFFPNLVPFYAPYNRGGHMVTLIYLKGTVPIFYQGVSYYIPVVVWIPETYPMVPPVIMLDPTPDMEIVKNHPQVGDNGMCHHQYLSSWTWQSNMSQAVKYLCDIYSGYPPLVLKSKPAPPPIPMDPNRDSPPPYGSSPSTSGSYNWNQPPPSYAESIQSHQQQPPPLPPKPQSPPSTTSSQQQQQQQQLLQQQREQREREQKEKEAQQREKNERDEALMKCTEKLQILLSQFYDTTSKEIESYSAHNLTLEKQKQHLEKEKETIKKDIDYYQGLIQSTTDQIDKLNVWIAENDKKDTEIDIDVISSPKDPLSRQLLTLVSEDTTIEDMLYYLDKALHSNRITLEEYLKNIRSLAREQFMIRATIKKVQNQLMLSQNVNNNHVNTTVSH